MSTAVLELPQDLDLAEGEPFAFEISGFAKHGHLIVEKLLRKPTQRQDRQQAVDQFIAKWTGAFESSGKEQNLDELRWQALKEKHCL